MLLSGMWRCSQNLGSQWWVSFSGVFGYRRNRTPQFWTSVAALLLTVTGQGFPGAQSDSAFALRCIVASHSFPFVEKLNVSKPKLSESLKSLHSKP